MKNLGQRTNSKDIANIEDLSQGSCVVVPTAGSESVSDGTNTVNVATRDTEQVIAAKKTYLGNQLLAFKRFTSADKLGFTAYDGNNKEIGNLQIASRSMRPIGAGSSTTYNFVSLGNYTNDATNYHDTQIGFRTSTDDTSSQKSFNFVIPKDTKANMNAVYGSSYDMIFLVSAITDGSTNYFANQKGQVDLSTPLLNATNNAINSIKTFLQSNFKLTQKNNETTFIGGEEPSPKIKIGYLESTSQTMNFQTAFTTACNMCIAYSLVNNSNYSDSNKGYVTSFTKTGFTVASTPNTSNSRRIYYIAMGY